MDFLSEVMEQGRRVTVDLLHGETINAATPYSPHVPEHLRSWLPDLFDRFPITLPWHKTQPIDPALHTVWLLDNTAFRSPQPGDNRPELAELQDPNHTQPAQINDKGDAVQPTRTGSGWEVEFVACYFVKNSGREKAKIVAHIAHELNVAEDDIATKKRIATRLEPFIDTVLPHHTVRVAIGGKEQQTLGPSSYSGISSGLHELHFTPSLSDLIQSSPVNLPPPFGVPSITIAADETGWGVISDIDDTIKLTQTPSPLGILHQTFIVEHPEAILGMPELYNHIHNTLSTPPFFYLSASPYNLYPFLRNFRDDHNFPPGTLILRDASWQNLGGLIASVTQDTQAYKVARMRKLHAWFPRRRFICIGDSTQSDPEAYGWVARSFPGWVRAIFIRKVTGIAAMDASKNEPERFEKAFNGLERRLWHVFTDPTELVERIDALRRDPEALVGGEMWTAAD